MDSIPISRTPFSNYLLIVMLEAIIFSFYSLIIDTDLVFRYFTHAQFCTLNLLLMLELCLAERHLQMELVIIYMNGLLLFQEHMGTVAAFEGSLSLCS